MIGRAIWGLIVTAVAWSVVHDAWASCSRTFENQPIRTDIDSVAVEGTEDGRPVNQDAINEAAGQWDVCVGTPEVKTQQTTSQNGQLNVEIRFRAGQNPGEIPLVTGGMGECGAGCGCVQHHGDPPLSATVYAYQWNASSVPCDPHMTKLIAHELGHVLGLDNTDTENCGLCIGRVMAPSTTGGAVRTEDCMNADGVWVTTPEKGTDPMHPCQGPPV